MNLENLMKEANSLNQQEQYQLLGFLMEKLNSNKDDFLLTDVQISELDRRSAEINFKKINTIPLDIIRAEIKEKYGF